MIRAAVIGAAILGFAFPAGAADPLTLVTTEFPPYMSESLPEGGVLVALTRAALQQAGREAKIQFMPWARALTQAQSGNVDGLIGAWHSKEREAFLAYPAPLLDNEIGFYARRNAVPKYTELPALRGLKIGTVRGYAYPPSFLAADLTTEEESDDFANLRKLNGGRIDLVLIDRSVADHLVSQNMPDARQTLQWIEPAILKTPIYTTFSKAAQNSTLNIQLLNDGLLKLKQSGAFATILARYKIAS